MAKSFAFSVDGTPKRMHPLVAKDFANRKILSSMQSDPQVPFTRLELTIMQVLWRRGDWISVVEIQEELSKGQKQLALPSIRTMLGILQEKEAVVRQGEGRKHLYRATVTEEATQSGIVGEMLEKAFHNNAGNLVAALLRLESGPGE